MGQWMYYLLFLLGLVLIIKGSDWFIDSVIWIAKVFKIPYIIIGATIVSICTTMPETFVSLTASMKGETDVAFGNAFGSIALNTGIIMGIILIFAKPIIEDTKAFKRNGSFLIFVLLLCFAASLYFGEINRPVGFVFIILLMYFLYSNYKQAKTMMNLQASYDIEETLNPEDTTVIAEGAVYDKDEGDIDISRGIIVKKIVFFLVGITAVIVGSSLLVDNGIRIAEILGVPSIVIAITFTALGTSLPELVTAISSIRKKVSNLGVGNIIGANILNVVQVIGVSALANPISIQHDPTIISFQIPMVLIIVGLAVVFGIKSKGGFKRWQGFVLLAVYSVFLMFNLLRENMPILGDVFF
jgi:cation:H+ antiporter